MSLYTSAALEQEIHCQLLVGKAETERGGGVPGAKATCLPSSPGSRKEPERIMLLGRSASEAGLPRGCAAYRSKAASWVGMLLERAMRGVPALGVGATVEGWEGKRS